jgi:phage tail sheath gpL-like
MPDSIVFADIPLSLRTPGVYVSVDHSRAGSALPQLPRKLLLIGQRFTSGSVAAGAPIRLNEAAEAADYFGQGSMLHRMAIRARAAAPLADIWAIALNEDAEGTAATGSLAFTGPATASGVLALYIGGQRITVGVASGDTATEVGDAVEAAINANDDLPVTAVNTTGTVALTCRWKGETGNDIDLRANYYTGEALPAGIGLTITAMASGAGNPDVTATLAALAGEWFYSWIVPFTDSANLALIESNLDDRWGPLDPMPGHAFTCKDDTHCNLTTFGETRNSKHVSTLGVKNCPTPTYEIAAAWGAAIDYQAANTDPLYPFVGLEIKGMLAPAITDRWTQLERNNLYFSGISAYTVDQGGVCRVDLTLTNYQTNAAGIEDTSLLLLNHKWGADYVRFAVRNWAATQFAGFKIAEDGTRFDAGLKVTTPSLMRGSFYELFRHLERLAIAQNFDQFKADFRIAISENDPTRVNAIVPPQLVSPLHIFAAAVQYRL